MRSGPHSSVVQNTKEIVLEFLKYIFLYIFLLIFFQGELENQCSEYELMGRISIFLYWFGAGWWGGRKIWRQLREAEKQNVRRCNGNRVLNGDGQEKRKDWSKRLQQVMSPQKKDIIFYSELLKKNGLWLTQQLYYFL